MADAQPQISTTPASKQKLDRVRYRLSQVVPEVTWRGVHFPEVKVDWFVAERPGLSPWIPIAGERQAKWSAHGQDEQEWQYAPVAQWSAARAWESLCTQAEAAWLQPCLEQHYARPIAVREYRRPRPSSMATVLDLPISPNQGYQLLPDELAGEVAQALAIGLKGFFHVPDPSDTAEGWAVDDEDF